MFQDGSGGGPTDSPPTLCRPGPLRPSKRAVSRHGCPVSASRTPQESGVAATDGGSSVPERVGTGEAITVGPREPTYLPRRLLTAREPVVALCPRKVHTADQRSSDGRVRSDLLARRPRQPSELNSAGRLCGSTRLPLGGFTYC